MSGLNAVPLLVGTVTGMAFEEAAILTKASANTKGSYIPVLAGSAAVAVGGMFAAAHAPNLKNVLQASSVAAAAALGRSTPGVLTGKIPL